VQGPVHKLLASRHVNYYCSVYNDSASMITGFHQEKIKHG